jgi:hypothetical protein
MMRMHFPQGSYVVLASEPLCICGVDVAAPNQLLRGRQISLEAAMQPFRKELSEHEVGSPSAGPASSA